MALKKKAAVKKKPKPTPAGKAKGTAVTVKKAKKVVKASAQKKVKPKPVPPAKKSAKSAKSAKVQKPVKPFKSASRAKTAKPSKTSAPAKSSLNAKQSKVAAKTKEPKKVTKSIERKAEKSPSTTVQKKQVIKNPEPVKAVKNSAAELPAKAKAANPPPPPKGKVPAKDAEVSKAKKTKDDSVDPLHAKAEKVIRELEETMDLSKMRPRIQALTSAPKPLPKTPQTPIRLPEPVNTSKVKFQLEFEFRSSPKILFASISDSSGLAGWFADEVITSDDVYTFIWEGSESHARLVALRDLQLVRFQWMDENDGTYFQFEIKEDDITSDIALMITDFANPGEKETTIRLWESQIQKLRMLLGSL
jgi:uncharacterized protein YndB with AHSA1/START domain